MPPDTEQWRELTRRAALASHRLVGWIFWDPVGVANYASLGVPDGLGYYIATRGHSLGDAGNGAVTAAFGSVHPDFVAMALDLCRSHTDFESAASARDAAVVEGLHQYVPDICEPLATMGDELWAAADALDPAGRALFASLRDRSRPDDPLLSAWLGVNCIREWRGDTHWAIVIADGLSMTAAGILDGAWRNYPDDWLPRSRGADDEELDVAFAELGSRGFVTGGEVNAAGLAHRQGLEDRLDDHCSVAWRHLGEARTAEYIDLMNEAGVTLLRRIDETAGPNWMPAARERVPPTSP